MPILTPEESMRQSQSEVIAQRKALFIAHFVKCFEDPALLPEASHISSYANKISIVIGVIGVATAAAGALAAPFTVGTSLIISAVGGGVALSAVGPQGFKALFSFFQKKQNKIREGWTDTLLSVHEHEVRSVLIETARQIARAYEYQISKLADDNAVKKMAAASLALIFAGIVKKTEESSEKFHLEFQPEALINTMLSVKCGKGDKLPTITKGTEPVKSWNAFNVFTKPGLRKSHFHQADHTVTQEFFLKDGGDQKYGYRDGFNIAALDDEFKIPDNKPNGHQSYIPLFIETPRRVVLEYAAAHRIPGDPASKENLNTYIYRVYAKDPKYYGVRAWCHRKFAVGADLTFGNFRDTDFSGAGFTGAHLQGATFRDACMIRTSLSKADLTDACFINADLQDAILDGTRLGGTDFSEANLSWAKMVGVTLDENNPSYIKAVTSYGLQCDEEVLQRMEGGRIIADAYKKLADITQRITELEKEKEKPVIGIKNFRECVQDYQSRDAIQSGIASKLKSSFQIAIVGEPGCGKTQLSLNAAAQYYKTHPDSVVWVLNAADAASLRHDYKELAVKLGLPVDIDDLTKIKDWVNDALKKRTVDKCIIIFDNANDRTIIEQYLPAVTLQDRGNIIVTTTQAEDFKDFAIVDATMGFSMDEAISFLKEVTTSKEEIASLLKELGDLPCSIAAAKMYMQTSHIKIPTYLKLLKQDYEAVKMTEDEMMKPFYESSSSKKLHAIKLVINSLDKKDREMLQYLAFFAAKNIPLAVLCPFVETEGALINKFLFVLRSPVGEVTGEDAQRRITIHDITQKVCLSILSREKSIKLLQSAISTVDKLFTRDNRTVELKNKNEVLIPHAQALLNKAAKFDITAGSKTELLSLRLKTAVYYQFTGRNEEARTVLFEVIKNIEEIFSKLVDKNNLKVCCEVLAKTDPRLPTLYAATLYHLGRTYIYLKDYLEHGVESKGCLEKAVNLRQIIDENKQTTELWNDVYNQDAMDSIIFKRSGIFLLHSMLGENIGFSPEQRIGYLKIAETGYDELVQAEEKASVRDDFNFRTCCRELSVVYRKWANIVSPGAEQDKLYRKAKENLYKSLDAKFPDDAKGTNLVAKLQSLPPSDTRIAKEYNACANLFLDLGEYILAKELFKKAKEVEKQGGEAGKNFPLADAYYGLAKIYLKEKKLSLASNCIDSCLEIRQKMNDRTINLAEQLQQEILQAKAPAPAPVQVPAGTLANSMSRAVLTGSSLGSNQPSNTSAVVVQPPSKP